MPRIENLTNQEEKTWQLQGSFPLVAGVARSTRIPKRLFSPMEQQKKRIYKSFTCDIRAHKGNGPVKRWRRIGHRKRKYSLYSKTQDVCEMTVTEAIDKYITSREMLNRSPTTIQEYRCTQKFAFQDIMQTKRKDLTTEMLQEAVFKIVKGTDIELAVLSAKAWPKTLPAIEPTEYPRISRT